MSPTCLDYFRTISEKSSFDRFLHFARVIFQFLALGHAVWTSFFTYEYGFGQVLPISSGTKSRFSCRARKPSKHQVKGLDVLDAVGPSFFQNRPATGERFAPHACPVCAWNVMCCFNL